MTKRCDDRYSTGFGVWLKQQSEIDSKLGFVTAGVDYVWKNYKTGKWMIIEEKQHMYGLTWSQEEIYETLVKCCKKDPKFQGYFLLQFERTSPEDGAIILNGKIITVGELSKFLRFGD